MFEAATNSGETAVSERGMKNWLVILGSPDWAGACACTEFLQWATLLVWTRTENGGFNNAEAAN